uniref:Choline/carnitine acyltransferase domain-containing protein n=1 Tax=Eutreptiella gymnastica TaxID=73025 RepID=A0A7S1IQ46_9EUGL
MGRTRVEETGLAQTCERYIDAITPLVSSTKQLRTTKNLVDDFRKARGVEWHAELQAMDMRNSHTSYLSAWWYEEYLKNRAPLPINMNPYLVLRDDPSPHKKDPAVRAACLIHSALVFKQQLDRGKLLPEVFNFKPPEYSQQEWFEKLVAACPSSAVTVPYMAITKFQSFPLDMSQFPSLFNSTRVPKSHQDELRRQSGSHVVVLLNDNVYKVTVLDAEGQPLGVAQIAGRLQALLSAQEPRPQHPVPVLTSEHRDRWAEAREQMEGSIVNRESLITVDSALFAVCLGDEGGEITNPVPLAKQMLHNGGRNRWWDKSFSLIVTSDAKAAINFEHSWGDGVAVLRFAVDVFNHSLAKAAPLVPELATEAVQLLPWDLSPAVQRMVQQANARIAQDCAKMNLGIMLCPGMGKAGIAKIGGRPDPFMQLAIQLAYWRIHRVVDSVYESCSTSAFKHGRTECIRGATIESAAFVKAMDDAGLSVAHKAGLLLKASDKHAQLSKDAKQGHGVDRHLYALSKIGSLQGCTHDMFLDPTYRALKADMLSTSSLYSDAVMLGGFGPVSPGYGVAYAAADDVSLFHITSWGHHTGDFCTAVQQAVHDMAAVLTSGKAKR